MKKKQTFSVLKSFYSDLEENNMLYAALVRTERADGILREIAVPQMPDGCFFFSAKDFPQSPRVEIAGQEIPVFCDGEVLFAGQPFGILCAPDEKVLSALAETIMPVYGDPPPQAPALPESEREILFSKVARRGDIQGAFDSAHAVFESEWNSCIGFKGAHETEGALCKYRAGILTVSAPTLWPASLRSCLSQCLGLDPKKIVIHRTTVSGLTENCVWNGAVTCCQAALAALKTGRPVRLQLSRAEQDALIDDVPLRVKIRHKTALSKEGRFLGMEVDIHADAGAYNPFISEIISRLAAAAAGAYEPDALLVSAAASKSSSPPAAVSIRNVDAHSFFALESHVNEIARKSEIFDKPEEEARSAPEGGRSLPLMLRLRNIRNSYSAMRDVLIEACRAGDFTRKHEIFRQASLRADEAYLSHRRDFNFPIRGVGLSCCFCGAGFLGSEIFARNQEVEVSLLADNKVEIRSMPPSATVEGIWKQAAADALDVPAENVSVTSAFSADDEPKIPDTEADSLPVTLELIRKCCSAIQKKRFRAPLPITVRKGITPAQRRQWNAEDFTGEPYLSNAFASCVMELSIDPRSFSPKIERIFLTASAGRIYEREKAEAAVKLCVQRTMGLLVEGTSLPCARITARLIPTEGPPAQIGTAARRLVPAAFISALNQAANLAMRQVPIAQDAVYTADKARAVMLVSEKVRKHLEAAMQAAEDEDEEIGELLPVQEDEG